MISVTVTLERGDKAGVGEFSVSFKMNAAGNAIIYPSLY